MQKVIFGLLVFFFLPLSVAASISVKAGTYEVPALVIEGKSGAQAVFNWRTRSECRVRLTGPLSGTLAAKQAKGLFIGFKIEKDQICFLKINAELSSVKPLENRKIPRIVENDFVPAENEKKTPESSPLSIKNTGLNK